jgi:hypothetical protein
MIGSAAPNATSLCLSLNAEFLGARRWEFGNRYVRSVRTCILVHCQEVWRNYLSAQQYPGCVIGGGANEVENLCLHS